MRYLSILLLASSAFGAIAYKSTATTRQQAVLVFSVYDASLCTVTVYSDDALTRKMSDTDNAVFAGSENCARPYNVVDRNEVTFVAGRRTSEASLAGTLVSRSLESGHTYYAVIRDTAAVTSLTVPFTTATIPWGDTHIDLPQPNNNAFGGWAYPDLDWSDAGQAKSYIDPLTGVAFTRGARSKDDEYGYFGDANTVNTFMAAVDVNGAWSNIANITNTTTDGPFASYSGSTSDAVILPVDYTLGGFYGAFLSAFQSNPDTGQGIVDDLGAIVYGSATDANPENRKVLVCLWYGSGCSPDIEVTLNQTTATSRKIPDATSSGVNAFPAYQYAGWNIGRYLVSDEQVVLAGSSATVNSSDVVLGANQYLPANAKTGWPININNGWYHIGTIITAAHFTLQEGSVTRSGPWICGSFGIRLRKKTGTGTINVSAGYSYVISHPSQINANGQSRDYFSRLTFPVTYAADGVTPLNPPSTGRLMVTGGGYQYMLLVIDPSSAYPAGETRWLGPVARGFITFPMLGAWSTTDPYTFYSVQRDPSDPGGGSSFWRGVYDYGTCKFKSWPGRWSLNLPVTSDCINWTNMNPYSGGASSTIKGQIATALASNPIWDASLSQNFVLGGISGNYAAMGQWVNQNQPCWVAVFDLTSFTLVKLFDSFSGSVPGLRWGGCHSNGLGITDRQGLAAVDLALVSGGNGASYMSGPYQLQPFTAKSLDGGSTWNSDTSLTNIQAGACGTNSFGVVGLQCLTLKFPSIEPCSTNAISTDATKWPCSWHSGWSSPMVMIAGDYITGNAGNGKSEKLRLLSLGSDGAGGYIGEFQRWARCDNPASDPNGNPPACPSGYVDHLYFGATGSVHDTGWAGQMAPSGTEVWLNLAGPNSSTVFKSDDSPVTSDGGHNTVGISPDGTSIMAVGGGFSRVGPLPAQAATRPDYSWNKSATYFNGISKTNDYLETYPTLAWNGPTQHTRSLGWDWRHLNPDNGIDGDKPAVIWPQTYTLVSGQQFTYRVNVRHSLGTSALILKSRPPIVWSSRYSFSDLSSSSTGNVISDANPLSYCLAYKANECRTGSSVGDVYVVAPGAWIESGGCIVNTLKTWSPCVSNLESYGAWMIEMDTQHDDPLPNRYRRITMGLSGPGSQYGYTSPHLTPSASMALVRPSWLNGVRPDFMALKMPPQAHVDSVDRSMYVPLPITLPPGSGYGRIRFGYVETRGVSQYYCSSRRESCLTDANVVPFAYEQSDTLTPQNCSTGCTISVPALSGRTLYYQIETSPDGSTWTTGPTQIRVVP